MRNSVNLPIANNGLALQVFVDATAMPYGVLIPLNQWQKLKASVDPNSPLYQLMAKLTFIPFHQRSLQEKSEALQDRIGEVQRENLAKGSYVTYQNELCISDDMFINAYADRKELVRIEAATGKITVIKQLGE